MLKDSSITKIITEINPIELFCEDDDKILIDGNCVLQESELPKDLPEKKLDEIAKFVTIS